jgi:hypothetical protein
MWFPSRREDGQRSIFNFQAEDLVPATLPGPLHCLCWLCFLLLNQPEPTASRGAARFRWFLFFEQEVTEATEEGARKAEPGAQGSQRGSPHGV